MSNNSVSPAHFFNPDKQVAALSLIACPGAETFAQQIDYYLVKWAKEAGISTDTFMIECDCPRFQSGDAKGVVKGSVRGHDVFLIVYTGNDSLT